MGRTVAGEICRWVLEAEATVRPKRDKRRRACREEEEEEEEEPKEEEAEVDGVARGSII